MEAKNPGTLFMQDGGGPVIRAAIESSEIGVTTGLVSCRRGSLPAIQGSAFESCDGALAPVKKDSSPTFPFLTSCLKCGLTHAIIMSGGKIMYGVVL